MRFCVAAIIRKGNKILLVHERRDKPYEKCKGLLSLPAGKVEKGESLEEAVKREVKEETGLSVISSRFVSALFLTTESEDILGLIFECKCKGKANEFCMWLPIEEVFKMKLRFGMKEAIESYLKFKLARS